jgi:3,4-dihydroxy 2-butanone 4-phosphate synthase/GTP cyclohydrolase II
MNTTGEIVSDVRAGRMVIVMDDETRENEADLIMAGEAVTPETVGFFVRHTSGIICQPMLRERLQQLRLPPMVPENTEAHRTAFTISVDYRHGTTTGISAHDRAKTIRALADPVSQADDFARPGHIFPLRYTDGGVLYRAGHTEATIDLVRTNKLKIGTIEDLIRHRLRTERSVERISEQMVRTEFGEFQLYCYEDHVNHDVHVALVRGNLQGSKPPLVRVHVTDTLRDVIGVQGDRGRPLRDAMQRIAAEGNGAIVILRQPESPREFVEAVRALAPSRPAPARNEGPQVLRTYGIGAQILQDLGLTRMRVLAAPLQLHGIGAFNLEIVEYVDS